jgi:hypothetical protein
MYEISVPISVPVSKKKRFYLNLNQYRNAHHFTLSKAKLTFHEIVKPLLGAIPRMERVNLTYYLYVGNHQLCDTSNICSIVDKFFSDVLVSCNKIEDDNFKVVLSAVYRYGGHDKGNPHVRIVIEPVGPAGIQEDQRDQTSPQKKEEKPMQITIRQPEIEQAIRNYVSGSVSVAQGKRIDMKLSAKRGPGGFQAVVDIVDENASDEGSTDTAGASEQADTTASTTEAAGTTGKGSRASSLFGGAASAPSNEPQAAETSSETAAA